MLANIELAAISVSVISLAIGSAFDLRTREVPDIVWLAFGPTGAILTLVRLIIQPTLIFSALVSLALTVGASLAMQFLGFWGGADTKALICLGLTLPIAPRAFPSIMGSLLPLPIMVIIFGYLCTASIVIWLSLRNLMLYLQQGPRIFAGLSEEPAWKKAIACLSGYPDTCANLKKKVHLYPMEKVVEDRHGVRLEFDFTLSAEVNRKELVSQFTDSLRKVGSPDTIWVNVGAPLLFFLLIGLILVLVVGDPIFSPILLRILP